MTDATTITAAHLEVMLDQAVAELARLPRNPLDEDDLAQCCDLIDEAVELIQHVPLRTLGDLRLRAKALNRNYDYSYDDPRIGVLLEALERLPERLWDEPIGQGEIAP